MTEKRESDPRDDGIWTELRAPNPRLGSTLRLYGTRLSVEAPPTPVLRGSGATSAAVDSHARTVVHPYCNQPTSASICVIDIDDRPK